MYSIWRKPDTWEMCIKWKAAKLTAEIDVQNLAPDDTQTTLMSRFLWVQNPKLNLSYIRHIIIIIYYAYKAAK